MWNFLLDRVDPRYVAKTLSEIAENGDFAGGFLRAPGTDAAFAKFSASRRSSVEGLNQETTISDCPPLLLRFTSFDHLARIFVKSDQGYHQIFCAAASAGTAGTCSVLHIEPRWVNHPGVQQALRDYRDRAEAILPGIWAYKRACQERVEREQQKERRSVHCAQRQREQVLRQALEPWGRR